MAQILLPLESGKRPKRPKRARAVMPSRRIALGVRAAIVAAMGPLVREVKNLVSWLGGTATVAQAASVMRELQERWRQAFGVKAEHIARQWTELVGSEAKKRLEASLARSLGIDMTHIFDDRLVADAAELMSMEAASLIKSIPEEYLEEARRAVLRNYQQMPFPEGRSLTEHIQHLTGLSETRARLIARDQTSKINTAINQARQTSIGIEKYVWRTAKDNRVTGKPGGLWPEGNAMHGDHWEREGKTCRWDAPPHDGHPGYAINCLPGDARVYCPDGCDKIWRRLYTGQLFVLSTETGGELKATPNHPVLTNNGWLPVNALKQGDNLIKCLSDGNLIGKGHDDQFVSSIEQKWDALNNPLACDVRRGTEFDFHGDGREGDVYVKWANRHLPFGAIPTLYYFFKKLCFARPLQGFGAFFSRNGLKKGSLSPGLLSTLFNGDMGSLNQMLSFLFTGLLHPREHAFGLPAYGNLGFSQYAGDNRAHNPEMFGESQRAFSVNIALNDFFGRQFNFLGRGQDAGDVDTPCADVLAHDVGVAVNDGRSIFELGSRIYQADRIVNIGIRDFSGHVYNLQTPTGYYISNNYVNHNCRCYAEPIIETDKLRRSA